MSQTGPESIQRDGSSLSIWRDAPGWEGKRTASVGKLRMASAESGKALLAQAAAQLKAEGFEAIIGPMEGDTWHAYRSVTETDGSPSFLMEPTSGAHDVAALQAASFAPISTYYSARVQTKDAIGDMPEAPPGISLENWDGNSPEAFFGEVYALSLQGFSRNAFYKPIAREEFLKMYMPYVPFLKRELIFFARAGDQLAGFLFAIPDYAQGPDTKTMIIKTYASGVRGVGRLLLENVHRNGLDLGYETTIHALMHEDNSSLDRSRRHGGEVFRRYTLFGRDL